MGTMWVRSGGAWVDSAKVGAVRYGDVWVPFGPSGGGTPQSLFTSQTPGTPDFSEAVTTLTVGTVIQVGVAGSVSAGRWYFPATIPGGMTAKFVLYNDTSGARLSEATFSSPTVGAWNEVTLPSPVAVSASDTLIAAVYLSGASTVRYVYTSAFFASPLVNGDLTGPSVSNGRFGSTDTRPTNSFNSTCYFVDLVFTSS